MNTVKSLLTFSIMKFMPAMVKMCAALFSRSDKVGIIFLQLGYGLDRTVKKSVFHINSVLFRTVDHSIV